MKKDPDVIVIGAGGGGPVIAKELGELGIRVLVLEAGPWYGNKKWPKPNENRGTEKESSDPRDLDGSLYRSQLTRLENDMNDFVSGKFRWGSADRRQPPWFRHIPDRAIFWISARPGGSTLHYYANSLRAFPHAIDNENSCNFQNLASSYAKQLCFVLVISVIIVSIIVWNYANRPTTFLASEGVLDLSCS